MPATMVTTKDEDIFKSQGAKDIMITELQALNSRESLALYTRISATFSETIQYFLTFDDLIKVIHFGKGVGGFTIEGTMYCDCDRNIPALERYRQVIGKQRGKVLSISWYDKSPVIAAILVSTSVSVVGEPDTMIDFTLNFSIIDHDMS